LSISLVYSLGFRATVSAARCLVVLPLLHLYLLLSVLHVVKINDDDDDDNLTLTLNSSLWTGLLDFGLFNLRHFDSEQICRPSPLILARRSPRVYVFAALSFSLLSYVLHMLLNSQDYRRRISCLSVRRSNTLSGLGSGDSCLQPTVERYCETSTCTDSYRPRSKTIIQTLVHHEDGGEVVGSVVYRNGTTWYFA